MHVQPVRRIRVEGSPVDQGSGETLPRALDAAPYLDDGETINTPVSSLLCLSTGELYPAGLSGSPTINGTEVAQVVTALEPRRVYLLVCGCTTNTGRVWEMELEIWCYR